jgi:hypothetical protein
MAPGGISASGLADVLRVRGHGPNLGSSPRPLALCSSPASLIAPPVAIYNKCRSDWPAGIAQLAERRLPKPKVAGSSPVSRSNATARLFDLRICRLRRYPHRERYLHDLILAMGPRPRFDCWAPQAGSTRGPRPWTGHSSPEKGPGFPGPWWTSIWMIVWAA